MDAKQLEQRRHTLGASEAAAVLGLSPFASPADVYWSKVLPVEKDAPTAAMQSGIRLEPVILEWCAERLGTALQRVEPKVAADGILSASPDSVVSGRNEGVEAKRTTMPDGWGTEGTDEIPDHYLLQTHHQMYVWGFERVWVPVLIIGAYRDEWRLYCVNRDKDVQQAIAEKEIAWWNAHVVPHNPPANEPPAIELLKGLRREPKSTVILGHNGVEAWEAYREACEAAKIADAEKEAAQARILAMLGTTEPAEAATLPDGRTITYLSQRSAPKVDHVTFKAEHPDLHQKYVTQGTHRVLRIKKASGIQGIAPQLIQGAIES